MARQEITHLTGRRLLVKRRLSAYGTKSRLFLVIALNVLITKCAWARTGATIPTSNIWETRTGFVCVRRHLGLVIA
jgi:hypothetical protein